MTSGDGREGEARQRAEEAAQERRRIQLRDAADNDVLRDAVRGLGSVLGAPRLGRPHDNPLLLACQAVGRHQGIAIVAPSGSALHGHVDDVSAISRASRIFTRRVVLRDDWWKRDYGPLLAFRVSDGAPLALLPTSPGRYRAWDPASGIGAPVDARSAREIAPHAWMFYRNLPADASSLFGLFRFALRTTVRDLRSALIFGAIASLMSLSVPIATDLLVGRIIPSGLRPELWDMALALGACALGSTVFNFTRTVAVLRLEGRMNLDVEAAVFSRLLSLDARFFRRFSTGDMASRVLGIDSICRIMTGTTLNALMGAIFSVLSFALLFCCDWRLALAATAMVAMMGSFLALVGWLEYRCEVELLDAEGSLSGRVLGMLEAIGKLRVAAAERRVFGQWAAAYAEQRRLAFRLRMLGVLTATVQSAFPLLSTALLVGVVGWNGIRVEPARFLAFSSALGQFTSAMLALGASMTSLLRVGPLLRRARPILDARPEADEAHTDPGLLQGDVRADRLTFRYAADGPPVVQDVSLEAARGQFVAVVGPSGSGKSTLLRLLLGFERPQGGQVYYDHQALHMLDAAAVRRQIGVVLQDGSPLPGSLFENIVGESLLTLDDAWEAARIAGLEADIRAMPMGMHTLISSGASTLSGGQRQRLMMARAVAGGPRLLLLDEATSALDATIQDEISRNLEALDVTRIVIAHRLSTIRNADYIYVMRDGRVVQKGTFTALLAEGGLFGELVSRQMS